MNTQSKKYFGTINTITCDVKPSTIEQAFNLCGVFERRLSRFLKKSDVWRINHSQGKPTRISNDTQEILACAEKMKRDSHGAFNIATGEASRIWNFTATTPAIPQPERIAEVLADLQKSTIRVEDGFAIASPNTTIDLGGIAKGYICDKVADYLRERGATSGVLCFGGNIVTIGQHPQGRPWKIGLQSPRAKREESLFAYVTSADSSVVTSGAYERCFTKDGTLYHHILDPRTCEPTKTNISSVSIIVADSMIADALATAVFILGDEQGFALAHQYDAKAVILHEDGRLCYSAGLYLQPLDANETPTVAYPLGK